MVAHLVRLRLTLMTNTLRRSVWQSIGFVLGGLYAVFVLGLLVLGAVAGGTQDPLLTGHLIIIVGAGVMIGWWLVPLFAFGTDAILDPQRFVTFGIPRRTLLAGLSVAALTSLPGAVTVLAAGGVAFAWWRTPLVVLAALGGNALAVALCVVGSRALTTALVPVLDSRRTREVLMVVALVLVVMVGPTISGLGSSGLISGPGEGGSPASLVRTLVGSVASVVAWTPFGAPWAVSAAVHEGAWLLAIARLAVSLVSLGVLWKVWDVALARALVSPPVVTAHAAKGKGLGWFDRVPSTPTGAVMGRCLVYWFSDPRYFSSVVIVPLLPVLLLVMGGGVSGALLFLAPFTAWLLAFSISTDIAYDYTAFALHVATGVSGRADRAGRVLALTVLSTPVLTAFLLGSLAATGRWDLTPMVFGVTVGLFGVTAGISSAVSAWLVYPAAKPGDSPLKQPQGAAIPAVIMMVVGSAATVVLALPVLVPAILTLALSPAFGWVTVVVGPLLGVTVCVAGIRLGGHWYDRRTPELLQQVVAQK